MRLTSLDIHHKEFRHSIRGYAEDEVDKFLDEVADEFERLLKENIELSEQLQTATARIKDFEIKESAVNNAIIAAQTAGEEMMNKARSEADATLHDAEIKAKEIIHNALAKKQQIAAELVRIKQAEEDFRSRFKGLLEQHQRSITEVDLPDDVEVLLGETDEGVAADVVVRPEPAAAPAPYFEPPAAPAFEAAPAAPAPADVSAPTQAMPPVEAAVPETPAESRRPVEPERPSEPAGHVESVQLGELNAPDLPDDVDLVEPSEFTLPGLKDLGEREDDLDIEEID